MRPKLSCTLRTTTRLRRPVIYRIEGYNISGKTGPSSLGYRSELVKAEEDVRKYLSSQPASPVLAAKIFQEVLDGPIPHLESEVVTTFLWMNSKVIVEQF